MNDLDGYVLSHMTRQDRRRRRRRRDDTARGQRRAMHAYNLATRDPAALMRFAKAHPAAPWKVMADAPRQADEAVRAVTRQMRRRRS